MLSIASLVIERRLKIDTYRPLFEMQFSMDRMLSFFHISTSSIWDLFSELVSMCNLLRL